ncbi:MAG TPA: DUF4097 family beta strand repeat-containing protein [Bacteroidales bacterium]
MKTPLTLLVASFIFLSSCNGRGFTFSDKSYKSSDKEYSFMLGYKVSSPANLKISTSGGNIKTSGREGDSIEVAFVVRKKGQVLDVTLDQLKEMADVEITHGSNNLEINVKRTYERNISVGFIIKTPLKTSANLNTSGGNVSISEIEGSHTVRTSGGNIECEKITGSVDAGTSGGNVTLSNSTADFEASTSGGNISMNNITGKLHVSTSGGNIEANTIKPEITAYTSGGGIRLKNVQGPVDVKTSGGSIHLDEISGSVKATTSGGNISANITQLTTKLELETSGGSIDVTIPGGLGMDLDLSADHIDTPLKNFTGTAKKDRIKGQMNGGGIPVHLSTSGGSISLDYK